MNTHTDNEDLFDKEFLPKAGHNTDGEAIHCVWHQHDKIKRFIQANYTPKSDTDTNVGVTPQAAVQGDAVVEWLTELGFEFHDDPDEPFWMKLEYTEHSGFTVKVTPHTAAYFYQQIKPHSALEAAPTKSSGELEDIRNALRLIFFPSPMPYPEHPDVKVVLDKAVAFIESWHTTQTTKLQAEARLDGTQTTNCYEQFFTELDDLSECNCESYINQVCNKCQIIRPFLAEAESALSIRHLEREHKVKSDEKQD